MEALHLPLVQFVSFVLDLSDQSILLSLLTRDTCFLNWSNLIASALMRT